MRDAFNLDARVIHDLEPLDLDQTVVNPVWRGIEARIKAIQASPGPAAQRIVEAPGCETRADRDTKEIVAALTAEIDDLKQRRGDTPKHIRTSDLIKTDKLEALPICDANIRLEPENGILRVRIPGLPNSALDRMLAPLLTDLTETRTIYPGTDLGLAYEIAAESQEQGSSDFSWVQDVRVYGGDPKEGIVNYMSICTRLCSTPFDAPQS